MNPLELAEIGSTGLSVTRLGLGGAPLGSLFTEVAEEAAFQTVRQGLKLGIRYIDTAPLYGRGTSEKRIGRSLAGLARDEFVISTKVGRVLNPVDAVQEDEAFANVPPFEAVFDFSRDGILRSLEESLQRLGLDRVDIALIHDPDDDDDEALRHSFPTLADLRSQGVVKAIGAGMNQWEALARFARDGDFDCFLLAGRYTLLDQSGLAEFLPLCERKGISVILGGPYNSGILASDLSPEATFNYVEARPETLERARKVKAVCDRHGAPLKAAALQFCLAHPAVAAIIPGARSASEVKENFDMTGYQLPAGLWDELREEGLIPQEAPTPS